MGQEEIHYTESKRGVSSRPGDKHIRCKFCTRTHPRNKFECPACGKSCSSCGKQNHFAVACQAKRRKPARKLVHQLEEDTESDEYVACMNVKEDICATDDERKGAGKLFATMVLNDHEVCFQLDSGATVNILPEEIIRKVYGKENPPALANAGVTLVMYNKTEETPLGKTRVRVINPKNGRRYSIEFMVVKGNCKPLLGSRASQQMHLISVCKENILTVAVSVTKDEAESTLTKDSVVKEFSDVFHGEGNLEGALHLEIDPSVPPVQLPTRKVPLAVKEKFREELRRLEKLNIIAAVNVPTKWISATVVTLKKNGKVRLCIDPKPLNQALRRNHYPMPIIEDILPELSKARCFSVLDAKNGF